MSATIIACIIIYLGLYSYTGDNLFPLTYAVGPMAVLFLFDKKEINENDLSIPAGKWIEKAIMMAVLGVFYSTGVLMAIIFIKWLIQLEFKFDPLVIFILIGSHFAPHLIKIIKAK